MSPCNLYNYVHESEIFIPYCIEPIIYSCVSQNHIFYVKTPVKRNLWLQNQFEKIIVSKNNMNLSISGLNYAIILERPVCIQQKHAIPHLDSPGVHTDDKPVDLLLEGQLKGWHPRQLAQQPKQSAQDFQGLNRDHEGG